ncbi:MAG: EhaF family protein [Methanocorpusculum sp.]|nr:EhaF family protein [Methanocorpusculum sp.]
MKSSLFRKLSAYLAEPDNLPKVYAVGLIIVVIIGLCLVPMLNYSSEQLYPKSFNENSSLNPYDRGGFPLGEPAKIIAQYPENAPAIGYVTAYLTPVSLLMAQYTMYLGTTIVAHPGGILDEILYYTRGFDTIVEASILLCAFAVAGFLFRRGKR